jgi:hypothetical protein
MSRGGIIQWSQRALKAFPYLLRTVQDVDVYIEDTNGKVVYERILKRLVGDKMRIRSVIPLNGRKEVIKHARLPKPDGVNPQLFIIDGDFEWVRGEEPPEAVDLYRLPAYCVENLLIWESALIKILVDETGYDDSELREKFDFEGWLNSFRRELVELYIAYAVLNLKSPTSTTVRRGHHMFFDADRKKGYCPEKLRKEVVTTLKDAENVAHKDEVRKLYTDCLERAFAWGQPLHVVSGKSALMPVILERFRVFPKVKVKPESLARRLADVVELQHFETLKEALESSAYQRN